MAGLHTVPVRAVRGVGPQTAEELKALGIESAADLLNHFPFRYEDFRVRELDDVQDGEKATLRGKVVGTPAAYMFGRGKSRMACKVAVDRFLITAVWFNQHYLKSRLVSGAEVVLTGKWDARRMQLTVSATEWPGGKSSRAGTLQPVYSVTGSLTQNGLRKLIRNALDQFEHGLSETLPRELLEQNRLIGRKAAVRGIHLPADEGQLHAARRRLAYEELFQFQLKMQARRALSRKRPDGIALAVDLPRVRRLVRSLPFSLTASQKTAIADILRDMQQPYAMNRLLQGDVGSGKTVVAAVALFAAVTAGYQGALMAPTEILAEQHMRSLSSLLEPFGVQLALLTGSLTERQRGDVLAGLQMGLIDIVIGTHALIQDDVYFRKLGLVVTDEQHRFGVNQRSELRRKGLNPDVLTMTATPIPRTLALTVFADLDVTTLGELPKGRKPVRTFFVKPDLLQRVLAFVRKETEAGRQAYIICPLIEESDKLDVQNALDVYAMLQQQYPDLRAGLLHGRMTAAEKDDVMRRFSANEVQVLVSTTVVEVGVDVPNATVMVVYDADRFGLSQLHQLRGRVGRGEHQSYCILLADPKGEIGKERMRVMTETNDGFEIARRDLELRGPGDFFGTKQSGLPEFRVADLTSDFALMEQARDDAARLLGRPEFWTAAEYEPLRELLNREQILTGEMLD